MTRNREIRTIFGATVLAAAEALKNQGGNDRLIDMLNLASCATDDYSRYSAIALVSMACDALLPTISAHMSALPADRRERLASRYAAINALIEAIRLSPAVAELRAKA